MFKYYKKLFTLLLQNNFSEKLSASTEDLSGKDTKELLRELGNSLDISDKDRVSELEKRFNDTKIEYKGIIKSTLVKLLYPILQNKLIIKTRDEADFYSKVYFLALSKKYTFDIGTFILDKDGNPVNDDIETTSVIEEQTINTLVNIGTTNTRGLERPKDENNKAKDIKTKPKTRKKPASKPKNETVPETVSIPQTIPKEEVANKPEIIRTPEENKERLFSILNEKGLNVKSLDGFRYELDFAGFNDNSISFNGNHVTLRVNNIKKVFKFNIENEEGFNKALETIDDVDRLLKGK